MEILVSECGSFRHIIYMQKDGPTHSPVRAIIVGGRGVARGQLECGIRVAVRLPKSICLWGFLCKTFAGGPAGSKRQSSY